MSSITQSTPLEIWRRIFDLTVTDYHPDLDPRGATSATVFDSPIKLKHGLRTKASLILVCKAWHDVAIECLFKDLHITQPATLVKLADALQESRRINGKLGHGWWTRSIFMSVQMTASPEQREHFILHARRLIKLCPQLETISASIVSMSGTPNQFMLALHQAAPTLKRMKWLSEGPKVVELVKLVSLCPQLQSLSIPRTFPSPSRTAEIPQSIAVPTLETVEFDIPTVAGTGSLTPHLPLMTHWDLPALRNVSIRCGASQHADILEFMTAHGSKITFFQYANHATNRRSAAAPGNGDLLPRILGVCPNLEDVVIGSAALIAIQGAFRRIGFTSTKAVELRSQLSELVESLKQDKLPNLEVVRLFGGVELELLNESLEALRERGMRLEQDGGALIPGN